MDKQACVAFQAGFANWMVRNIFLHGIAFHNVEHFYDLDPESFKRGDRKIVDMEMSVISDADGEENLDRDAIQMGEQIARWTRARQLGPACGTRMWFQALEQAAED